MHSTVSARKGILSTPKETCTFFVFNMISTPEEYMNGTPDITIRRCNYESDSPLGASVS